MAATRAALAIACAMTLAAPVSAEPAGAAPTADAVREADLAFARRAREAGAAQAFRETMDPAESLTYGGARPAHGAEEIFQRLGGDGQPRFRLEWVPTGAWGSQGGDMGVTVGDWARIRTGEDKPALTGRYVTVWRKDAAGAWKALIDMGEADEEPKANAAAP